MHASALLRTVFQRTTHPAFSSLYMNHVLASTKVKKKKKKKGMKKKRERGIARTKTRACLRNAMHAERKRISCHRKGMLRSNKAMHKPKKEKEKGSESSKRKAARVQCCGPSRDLRQEKSIIVIASERSANAKIPNIPPKFIRILRLRPCRDVFDQPIPTG